MLIYQIYYGSEVWQRGPGPIKNLNQALFGISISTQKGMVALSQQPLDPIRSREINEQK